MTERQKIIAQLIGAGCTEEWCNQFKTEDLQEVLESMEAHNEN